MSADGTSALPPPAPALPRRQSRNGRRGFNFTIRVTEDEREALRAAQLRVAGPSGLGPWLIWRALDGQPPRRTAAPARQCEMFAPPGDGTAAAIAPNVFARAGIARPRRGTASAPAAPALPPRATREEAAQRTILDLCAGSGAWSQPYVDAGYKFIRVTLPYFDVRTFPGADAERALLDSLPTVWGVLAAPPCTEFSRAKRDERDFVAGMECVNACMRIVAQLRPRWWCLENPAGHLSRFLGTARDSFEPHEFGDPWTKRTALWGDFALPRRGPFVTPLGSAMDRATADERAVTPAGFARAFFEANP